MTEHKNVEQYQENIEKGLVRKKEEQKVIKLYIHKMWEYHSKSCLLSLI